MMPENAMLNRRRRFSHHALLETSMLFVECTNVIVVGHAFPLIFSIGQEQPFLWQKLFIVN